MPLRGINKENFGEAKIYNSNALHLSYIIIVQPHNLLKMKKLVLGLSIAALSVSAESQAQTILAQDFEGVTIPALPAGYTDYHVGRGNGWETKNSAIVLSYATIAAHTKYAVVNDGGAPANYPAFMTTPSFSLASATAPYVSFDYNFQGFRVSATRRGEKAWVDLSTDNGTTWSTIDSVAAAGDWSKRYVSLGSTTSATCKLRFCYSDMRVNATDTIGILGFAIDNMNIFNAEANSLALESVTPMAGDPGGSFKNVGGTITFGGVVRNLSGSTISSFDASYKVGTGAVVTANITGASIMPMATYTFTCTTPYTVTAMGNQNTTLYITKTGDPVHTDDTGKTVITGVSFMPEKKIFFEEPTGTWCGWCVRGVVYMDSLKHVHGAKASIVAVHNGTNDPMKNDNARSISYDVYQGPKISGYPSLVVDRRFVGDPSDCFDYFDAMTNWFGYAGLGLSTSVSGSNLNAVVGVTPAMNLSGDYRLALVVTEDRVHGTATGYNQANYYSGGGSGAMQNAEFNFAALGNPVPAATMYYDHVARYTVPDFGASPNGVASSLPSSMTAGNTYYYTFSPIAISTNWVTNKLNVIALLIDNNPTSNTYGMSLNSTHTVWAVGVSDVKAGVEGLRVFPNPVADNAHVIFDLANNTKATVSVFDALGRVVYTTGAQSMTAGTQNMDIPVANFANGIYSVVIATENGKIAERFTVNK